MYFRARWSLRNRDFHQGEKLATQAASDAHEANFQTLEAEALIARLAAESGADVVAGIGDFAGKVADGRDASSVEQRTGANGQTGQSESPDEGRVMSIVGAVQLGANLTENGILGFIVFFIAINITIGIFNLLPLPILDGGHVVIATYERIREFFTGGERYYVDMVKLMPLFYAAFVGLVLLGLSTTQRLTLFHEPDLYANGWQFYAQDSWRVRSNLTVTAGLRYERFTPLLDRNNLLTNIDPETGRTFTAKDGNVFDRALIHPDRNDFAPRVGVAWWPGGRTRQNAVRCAESHAASTPPAARSAASSESRSSSDSVSLCESANWIPSSEPSRGARRQRWIVLQMARFSSRFSGDSPSSKTASSRFCGTRWSSRVIASCVQSDQSCGSMPAFRQLVAQ
jgi:hypothetical protein